MIRETIRQTTRPAIALLLVLGIAVAVGGCSPAEEEVASGEEPYGADVTEQLDMEEVAATDPEEVAIPETVEEQREEAGAPEPSVHQELTQAVAVLRGTEGNEGVTGQVTFTQTADGVEIEAHVNGLSPGKHGFHIHEFGDLSAPDGTSAGGHFNPLGKPHAGPDAEERHVGDLGNIEADESGHAMMMRVDKHVMLSGPLTVISRAVVVHGGEDDLTSQPSGAAGPRVAIGVIGIAPDEE